MGLKFNADEILAIAEQIERNGARFYRKAAENAKAGKSAGKLIELARMEENHEKVFAAMRAGLSEKQKGGGEVYDPQGEAEAYLQAFAGGHVFDVKKDPSATLTGRESLVRILRTAIGLEKDSIVFYLGLKPLVPPELGAAKVDEIIAEEMKHITILSMELMAERY
ncbi:MAG: ferritin family protein [Planctomycetota bacterium]|nr:ferritin family protein [Planctomycetota bacterium]